MLTATGLEKRGTPAVAILSAPFERSGRAMAERQGFRDYDFVVLEHPLSTLSPAATRTRALEAVEQVLRILGERQASKDAGA